MNRVSCKMQLDKQMNIQSDIYRFYELPDAKSIVVSGDIHDDFTQLVYKCCIQYAMTNTLIIVAGDCGFGFKKAGYYENGINVVESVFRRPTTGLHSFVAITTIRPISISTPLNISDG